MFKSVIAHAAEWRDTGVPCPGLLDVSTMGVKPMDCVFSDTIGAISIRYNSPI